MRTATTLLLMIVLSGITPCAFADKPENYLALKGGFYAPDNTFDLDAVHFDTKHGFDGEVAFGHYFLPFLAAEFGAGYFQSTASPAIPVGETKLKVVPVVLTGKLLLPLGPLEPYGEFGIGAYFTKIDISGTINNFSGSTQVTYGLHAGAGVNINLTDCFFIGAEGRYLWAKPSFGGQDIKLDGFTATANLGVRF